jgi:hypothetical protein
MTTSMVAEGKLMVALNRGEPVPEGWIEVVALFWTRNWACISG